MKEKIKKTLLGIIIGVFTLPTIILGGSFTVSLIQGKSVEEAIQILAEQIDYLIGRVEVLETKQTTQEQALEELQSIIEQRQAELEQEKICKEYQELIATTPRATAPGELGLGEFRDPLVGVDYFITVTQEVLQNFDQTLVNCPELSKSIVEEMLAKAIKQRPLLKTAYENCDERNKYHVHWSNADYSDCLNPANLR